MGTTQHEKGERFRALHEGGAFVIPNPWDVGSAKVLAGLGFAALATTSSGFAFTLGRHDGGVTLDEVVDHTRALAEAVDVPISVDLENGYGVEPAQAALAIERAAEVGAVGGSIEDYDPDDDRIYELDVAIGRVSAAVEAARALDFPFVLTARAENHIRGNPDLEDTVARLQAFERAGADVLYAPGLRTIEEIEAVCKAVSKPVNVLARPKLSAAAIFEAGAQRISLGGSLAFLAVSALGEAAETIRDDGDFAPISLGPKLRDWLSALG
jgi:2-methylisocitrate lyase-like PEP mutase family enzyme